MGPDSIFTVVLLLLIAAAGVAGTILLRRMIAKIGCGLLAMTLCVGAGMAVVNDYYGYYTSWSQLSADLSGSYSGFATPTTTGRSAGPVRPGEVRELTLRGRKSGITRGGLVYLPPQYFDPHYAHIRFPVVELLHGTPGKPSDWVVHLRLAELLDKLIADHDLGPMIVVMPAISTGRHYEECVDAPGALDDTYISSDVRADVLASLRATADPAEWGVAGYSSGGYCAVNLALRHPASFGAAGIMDGYFRPTDGPAAAALHDDPAGEAANDPLLRASRLPRDAHPLPAFWLSAGTGNNADLAAARAFSSALHGVEQVTLYREPGAGHDFYAWRAALPSVLTWMWTQLASPELRVQFPIAGRPRGAVIAVPSPPGQRHHVDASSGTASTPASLRCCAVIGAGAAVNGS